MVLEVIYGMMSTLRTPMRNHGNTVLLLHFCYKSSMPIHADCSGVQTPGGTIVGLSV